MIFPSFRQRSTRQELRLLTAQVSQLERRILDLSQQIACLSFPYDLPTTGPIEHSSMPLARYPERKISKVYVIKQSHEVIAFDQADNRFEQYCGPLRKVGLSIRQQFKERWIEVDASTGVHKSISVPLSY